MMRALPSLLIGMTTMLVTPFATSAPTACSATSGATVPAIVELYTSEGCDSCPPADRWLSSLKDQAARGTLLPLAFHIDYWDYLGWKDPYAIPAFGERQRERAGAAGAKVVYTPQVLFENREFQQWRRTTAQKLPLEAAKPSRAELQVAAVTKGTRPGSINVTVTGATRPNARGSEAYVAIYENDLASDVKAGENRGVILHHDFVVRRWLGPFAFKGNRLDVSQTIDLPPNTRIDHAGVAVIAQDDQGAVLQAVALPLRDCAG